MPAEQHKAKLLCKIHHPEFRTAATTTEFRFHQPSHNQNFQRHTKLKRQQQQQAVVTALGQAVKRHAELTHTHHTHGEGCLYQHTEFHNLPTTCSFFLSKSTIIPHETCAKSDKLPVQSYRCTIRRLWHVRQGGGSLMRCSMLRWCVVENGSLKRNPISLGHLAGGRSWLIIRGCYTCT